MSKHKNGNDKTNLNTDMDTDAYLERQSDASHADSDNTTDALEEVDTPEIVQPNDLKAVNQSLAALQDLFEKQIARNQNQTEMFDKLHADMKDYKESFLLEVLHKPIIHNLIQLYDSFVSLESQFDDISRENRENINETLSQYKKNLENFRFKLEEVLYRMDVTPYTDSSETLDRHLHKTRQVISSDDPEQDRKIAEVHKIGFNWRDKVFRPEEVTIFRYVPNTQKSDDIIREAASEKKGDRTDG